MAEKKKKKTEKIEIKVRKGRARQVTALVNDEPVANVVKLTAGKGKSKIDNYLTTNPKVENPGKTIQVHRTKEQAIGRFSRFPRISKKFKKLV